MAILFDNVANVAGAWQRLLMLLMLVVVVNGSFHFHILLVLGRDC